MKTRRALTALIILLLVSITTAAASGAPENFVATVSGRTVALTWNASSTGNDATNYVVEASLSPRGRIIASLRTSETTLVVPDVPNGVYYVHVRGVDVDAVSPASNEVIVVVPGGGACVSSPPQTPADVSGTVSGNIVTVGWAAPVAGCAATRYVVQAGSAPGFSNVAVVNIDEATTLAASAPPGIYYVRVLALNAFGASASSSEIVLTVQAVTLDFDGLAVRPNRSAVTSYTESGFTITPTAANWFALTTYGSPAPSVVFEREASQDTIVGEVSVTSGGAPFAFEAIDLYSSVTSVPYEMVGLSGGVPVFTLQGTVPNTFGRFMRVVNPQRAGIIDTLLIRLANPATMCCSNPVGLDNIILVR